MNRRTAQPRFRHHDRNTGTPTNASITATTRNTGSSSTGGPVSEVLGQEPPELDAHLGVFRCAEEPAVRHRLPDVQLGIDPGVAQLAVEAHRVREEEVARPGLHEGRWEPGDVAEDRREVRV